MYICQECGNKFDVPAHWKEPRGEYWGIPCYEDMAGCPFCRGSFIDELDVEEGEEDEC